MQRPPASPLNATDPALPFNAAVPALPVVDPVRPSWDMWPRWFSGVTKLSDSQTLHVSGVTAFQGMADEGREPYFRDLNYHQNSNPLANLQANGVQATAWIECMDESRAIVGAIHTFADGSFQQDASLQGADSRLPGGPQGPHA